LTHHFKGLLHVALTRGHLHMFLLCYHQQKYSKIY